MEKSLQDCNQNNYKITIKDTHIVDGEKYESLTYLTGGLSLSDDGYTISYEDCEGDLAGSVTRIKVSEPNAVYMSREGDFSTDLVLELKKRHNCHYSTPHGGFMLGVYAYKIASEMSSKGGSLNFAYSLDVAGGAISENELNIDVREMSDV